MLKSLFEVQLGFLPFTFSALCSTVILTKHSLEVRVVATLFLHQLQFNTVVESSLQENRKDWIIVYVENLYIHIIQLCILFEA